MTDCTEQKQEKEQVSLEEDTYSVSCTPEDNIDPSLYLPHATPYINQDFRDDASHDTVLCSSEECSEDAKTEIFQPDRCSTICSLSDDLPDYQSHIQQEVNTIATDSYHTAIRQPDSSYTDLSAYQNGSTDSACSLQPNPKHDSDDDLYELDEMTVQDFLAIESEAIALQEQKRKASMAAEQSPEKKQQPSN
ncbi:hypothetical protein BD560DRAFT_383982 [Blakeslea trispora]|nr:hypothetical protein BD560DRAFT_383982 [Blakeslea trispora]